LEGILFKIRKKERKKENTVPQTRVGGEGILSLFEIYLVFNYLILAQLPTRRFCPSHMYNYACYHGQQAFDKRRGKRLCVGGGGEKFHSITKLFA
jgi:hypothetical protein